MRTTTVNRLTHSNGRIESHQRLRRLSAPPSRSEHREDPAVPRRAVKYPPAPGDRAERRLRRAAGRRWQQPGRPVPPLRRRTHRQPHRLGRRHRRLPTGTAGRTGRPEVPLIDSGHNGTTPGLGHRSSHADTPDWFGILTTSGHLNQDQGFRGAWPISQRGPAPHTEGKSISPVSLCLPVKSSLPNRMFTSRSHRSGIWVTRRF